jgi:hypothetical protein
VSDAVVFLEGMRRKAMMGETTVSWAARELQYVDLGDERLNRRLVSLVAALADQPTSSVPEACGDWAATKGAYRFWSSDQVSVAAIQEAHGRSTIDRVRGHEWVLAIQDTTSLDFTDHPATQGMGILDHPARRGLKVHSVLMVSTQGVPLGIIHQEVWSRDPETLGKKHLRRARETKDKESQRWLTALERTQESLPEETNVITVADREADIYDLLATPRRPGAELLIRATHNRRVDHQARYLWETMAQCPVQGEITITLQRRDHQEARSATLTLRYQTLAIQPPQHRRSKEGLSPVEVAVILAQEESPPPGITPVRWLLFTTLAVNTFQEAVQCLKWYSYRWLVERYHFVLKSGCNLEKLQLGDGQRIHRALATYSIVAWRLLWITYQAREDPQGPCTSVLETHEWQSLYCTAHRTPIPPERPPTLQEAVRWIARLGGFLGRTHDGSPGVKTIWRGLRRLNDIANTWKLLHPDIQNQAVY